MSAPLTRSVGTQRGRRTVFEGSHFSLCRYVSESRKCRESESNMWLTSALPAACVLRSKLEAAERVRKWSAGLVKRWRRFQTSGKVEGHEWGVSVWWPLHGVLQQSGGGGALHSNCAFCLQQAALCAIYISGEQCWYLAFQVTKWSQQSALTQNQCHVFAISPR